MYYLYIGVLYIEYYFNDASLNYTQYKYKHLPIYINIVPINVNIVYMLHLFDHLSEIIENNESRPRLSTFCTLLLYP